MRVFTLTTKWNTNQTNGGDLRLTLQLTFPKDVFMGRSILNLDFKLGFSDSISNPIKFFLVVKNRKLIDSWRFSWKTLKFKEPCANALQEAFGFATVAAGSSHQHSFWITEHWRPPKAFLVLTNRELNTAVNPVRASGSCNLAKLLITNLTVSLTVLGGRCVELSSQICILCLLAVHPVDK